MFDLSGMLARTFQPISLGLLYLCIMVYAEARLASRTKAQLTEWREKYAEWREKYAERAKAAAELAANIAKWTKAAAEVAKAIAEREKAAVERAHALAEQRRNNNRLQQHLDALIKSNDKLLLKRHRMDLRHKKKKAKRHMQSCAKPKLRKDYHKHVDSRLFSCEILEQSVRQQERKSDLKLGLVGAAITERGSPPASSNDNDSEGNHPIVILEQARCSPVPKHQSLSSGRAAVYGIGISWKPEIPVHQYVFGSCLVGKSGVPFKYHNSMIQGLTFLNQAHHDIKEMEAYITAGIVLIASTSYILGRESAFKFQVWARQTALKALQLQLQTSEEEKKLLMPFVTPIFVSHLTKATYGLSTWHTSTSNCNFHLSADFTMRMQLSAQQQTLTNCAGRVADRGAEFSPARECFELLGLLKAQKKTIRRATVNTFSYFAKGLGPQDVIAALKVEVSSLVRDDEGWTGWRHKGSGSDV
ncbi:hypothetical protein C8J56DRAFT_1031727 [Mycena floridula]|nr:hypothetical protein C8J56DRAFT_1031727 [Mycena floridula]